VGAVGVMQIKPATAAGDPINILGVEGSACAQLVQFALDRGGRDNVTVIVAACTFPDEH
jgi:hypothetical protein